MPHERRRPAAGGRITCGECLAFLRETGESPLTKSKYLWLFSEERLLERHAEAFADLQAREFKVRAGALKAAVIRSRLEP